MLYPHWCLHYICINSVLLTMFVYGAGPAANKGQETRPKGQGLKSGGKFSMYIAC